MTIQKNNPQNMKFDWRSFGWAYLFFFYFSGLYQALLVFSGSSFIGLRQAFLMSFLWLIPLLLASRYTRFLSATMGFILWLSSLVSMGYWMLYGQEFSQSVLFIIFESNMAESTEFLESYFRWWMVPVTIIYSYIPYLLWTKIRPISIQPRYNVSLVVVISITTVWPFLNEHYIDGSSLAHSIVKQETRMEPAAPWHLVIGFQKYRRQLNDITKNLFKNKHLKPISGLVNHNTSKSNTVVLVIGESTNRQRMGVYDYYRDTTPKLKAMSSDLILFDNVYAPRPYTIETLEQVLSFADSTQPRLFLKKPTLMNMMKQAGYKTYWITNQQTQTQRNTMLTTFSKQADEQIYLNNNRSQNSSSYDGKTIAPYQKILTDKAAHKFVVVHLIGTHRKYKYRFPDDYAQFTAKDTPKWVTSNTQISEYNNYDNAVLYNDYVVTELINTLKRRKEESFLLYLSDHGEEVYDFPERMFAGRNEGDPSSPMYTIPFLFWANDLWKSGHNFDQLKQYSHRAYSSSDLIYTWADLCDIQFEDNDPSRSLVSDLFSEHPIWIGNPFMPKTLRDLQKSPFNKLKIPQSSPFSAALNDEKAAPRKTMNELDVN